ncbi:hypothetical protein [Candidatus Neptunochlamydia vexilliferae]|uniref:Nudix hydrolase domain-containing protein n=1 Tax=Candidatus Neptunichlamydia vexilliferae TaxID=1651774 RepID=A0ABS0B1L7_9BACT|nr:hypothetical protein [Candidatus Neptunochlamydia vexilliferae]MBF5060283.1 hypothetical protein [Candidatus Neptunochlamydia vexilliferae]
MLPPLPKGRGIRIDILMKRLLKIFLFVSLLIGIERLCHRATDGFAMVNVYAPPGNNSEWKSKGSPDPALLNQTYTYFNSGSQSYVFLSEDGKTILKLFKFQHMRTPPWLNLLPSVGKLGEKRTKKRAILEQTFNSYTLAYEKLREETGLHYIHLTKTDHLQTQLTIVDKIGVHHTLDLDGVEFVLQKRGALVYDQIDQWMEAGEHKRAEKGLRALLRLAVHRCHQGLFDKDPDFATNFGFMGETPFQIDFGRLSVAPEEKNPEVYAPEMIRITRALEAWIQNNHPALFIPFKEELDAITHP